MERFKQEKITVKISIGENILYSFIKKTTEFKKLDEVGDADEINHMKKNTFEAWSMIISMRVSDKIKHGELMHDFSIRYAIRND